MYGDSVNTKSRDFINANSRDLYKTKSHDSTNTMSQQYASSYKTIFITHICNDVICHQVYVDESMCIELALSDNQSSKFSLSHVKTSSKLYLV